MPPSPPRLRITQHESGNDFAVRVSGDPVLGWSRDECEIWRASRATVASLNGVVAASLDQLRLDLKGADPCDLKVSEVAFGDFVRSIYDGYWENSESDTTTYRIRRERLNDLLQPYIEKMRSTFDEPQVAAKHAPVVEFVSTRQAPVPYELLAMGQRPRPGESLRDTCLRLPAFSSNVRHLLYRTNVNATEAAGRALVSDIPPYRPEARAFLRSIDTRLWEKMDAYFAKEEVPRRAFEAAPVRGTLDKSAEIAKYLLSPWPLQPSSNRGPVSDIHVYAHGITGAAAKAKFRIRFEFPVEASDYGPTRVEVKTLDLKDAMWTATQRRVNNERPLIWLNCCEAAGAVGQELFSTSVDLADFGCRVIAPRTAVPEGLATALARDFYRFLNMQLSPGEAFLAARLESVVKRNNPLGVLYVGLGDIV